MFNTKSEEPIYDEFTEFSYIDFRNLSTWTGKSAKFCVLLLLRK